MKASIPTIGPDDLDLAISTQLGVESRLSISYDPVRTVATISQDAAAVGTLKADRTYSAPSSGTAGRDMQFICNGPVLSPTGIYAVLGVTLDDNTTTSGVASLAPPTASQDQSFNFPAGIGVDIVLTGANAAKKIKSVDSLTSIVGGAAGNRFSIISVPEQASYFTVACVTNRDLDVPTPNSIAIACGYKAARWVKRGRSVVPKLDLKANYAGFGDGLPRVNGQRVTAMLETRIDDRILVERLIVGGYRPVVKVARPDGDGMAEASVSGMFESDSFAVFV